MAVCSLVGKLVSIDDCMAVRPAFGMKDSDMLNRGKYRFRFLHTPHVPHCWEAGLSPEAFLSRFQYAGSNVMET